MHKTYRHVCLALSAISALAATKPVHAVSAHALSTHAARRNEPLLYAINVDPGTKLSRAKVTTTVADILADSRGWEPLKHLSFVAVPWSEAKLRIWVMQPDEIDRRCAPLSTDGYTSCAIGWNVFINADRWKHGAKAAHMNNADYRRYVVNHEVGHALGERHRKCTGNGRLAPVMLQQTLGLNGCRPNPWPNPTMAGP